MFQNLHALESACTQLGGLARIYLVDPLDLDVQPSWWLAPTIEALDFATDKGAFSIGEKVLSGVFVDNTDIGSPAGDAFTMQVQATLLHSTAEVDWLRNKVRNRKVHLIIQYRTGLQRFVPYCRLQFGHSSGTRSEKITYAFSAASKWNGVAPWLTDLPPVIGPTPIPPPTTPDPGTVEPVEIVTGSTTYAYTIPEGMWLVGWETKGTLSQAPKLGLSAGANDLGECYIASTVWVGQGNNLQSFQSNTIYFSGFASGGSTTIKLWLLGSA